MNMKKPATHLTVVIRDDSPLIHCGDNPSYRRVTIKLTDDQINYILLKATSQVMGNDVYESVSNCFLEDIA